ncbi:MAG: hypothetical protein ACLQPD_24090 [Desulfomonilaceae bacterium]
MKNLNLLPTILTASLLAAFILTGTYGLAANGEELQPQNATWVNGSNMVCVPEPEQTGTGFRLSCHIPDIGPQGTTRPARSNSEILRDMYREKYEPPFWRN